jgi:hypothetical protein
LTHPCPRCSRPLPACGELFLTREDGTRIARTVYSCGVCLVLREVFGEKREMALSFILGPDGQPMDPTDPGSPFRLE